jgi:hypothetical protein
MDLKIKFILYSIRVRSNVQRFPLNPPNDNSNSHDNNRHHTKSVSALSLQNEFIETKLRLPASIPRVT